MAGFRKIWLLLLLLPTAVFADGDPLFEQLKFKKFEIPFYVFADYTPQVALRMEYANSEILNTYEWLDLSREHIPFEVDLVFTKYPENIKAWRTDYYELLESRLEMLFALDSAFTRKDIRWNMVLQTRCKTEDEAKKYFHGFVVKYHPREQRILFDIETPEELEAIITGEATLSDSTIFKVLERNSHWDSMLVVTDWTGSMYKFGAQVVIWHKYLMSFQQGRALNFVFFNDGNDKMTWQKKTGRTGGIFLSSSDDPVDIVETMKKVMRKGNGGDSPENDLEAILTSIDHLSGFKEVILIADNKSFIRDLTLLEEITIPIRIVLCDVRGKINPDYLRLAARTGGSIHTLRRDYNTAEIRRALRSLAKGS